jgi:hypothetical protein
VLAVVPRRKSPLQLAAFTAALIMAFEFLLTHWTALYIVWFLPVITVGGDVLREAPIAVWPSRDGQAPPDDGSRHPSAARTAP